MKARAIKSDPGHSIKQGFSYVIVGVLCTSNSESFKTYFRVVNGEGLIGLYENTFFESELFEIPQGWGVKVGFRGTELTSLNFLEIEDFWDRLIDFDPDVVDVFDQDFPDLLSRNW